MSAKVDMELLPAGHPVSHGHSCHNRNPKPEPLNPTIEFNFRGSGIEGVLQIPTELYVGCSLDMAQGGFHCGN